MKNPYRAALRIVIVAATVAAFVYYLHRHPVLLRQLARTPPSRLAELLGLYVAWFAALALTVHATLRVCGVPLQAGEHTLLCAYSTLVNFFVPGQGGLAVRGLYMKKRYALGFRHYVLASLIYYACYAVVSALMLLGESRPRWQTLVGVAASIGFSYLVLRWYSRKDSQRKALEVNARNLAFLLLATILQATVQVAVYMTELRTVNPEISLKQAVTYTGAANFSLFVALTPGAIGIRESFLLFSRKLHHVATSTIVAASLIDRAVFMILLALLFLFVVAFHARRTLRLE